MNNPPLPNQQIFITAPSTSQHRQQQQQQHPNTSLGFMPAILSIPAEITASKASVLINEFRSYNELQHTKTPSNDLSVQSCNNSWSPPSKDWLKINVDAHSMSDGRWGLGLILRREDGGTVVVVTKVIRSSDDAKTAEALGIWEALHYIQQNGLSSVVIESDSQSCVKAISDNNFDRSYWGKIIQRCSQIGSRLDKIKFNWTRRCNNHTAHAIARWAAIEPDRQWTEKFPRSIFDHIQKDMIL